MKTHLIWLCIAIGALFAGRRLTKTETIVSAHSGESIEATEVLSQRPIDISKPTPKQKGVLNDASGKDAALMDTPGFHIASALSVKEHLDISHAALFRRLKLPVAQFESLLALLTERELIALDSMRASTGMGLSRAAVMQVAATARSEIEDRIERLLGAERFEIYKHFRDNQAAYDKLNRIERRLTFTDTPLGSEQHRHLLDMVIRHTRSREDLGPVGLVSPMVRAGMRSVLPEEVIEEARSYLSEAQFAVLRQLRDEDLARQRARLDH